MGFGMILGGAMSGWSDASLDEIKAARAQRLEELQSQQQDARAAAERTFQGQQNDLNRAATAKNLQTSEAFTADQNQKERDFRQDEAQDQRDATGTLVSGNDGTSYSRSGATVTPITDDQGNPVTLSDSSSSDSKPAEVSTAEWLVKNGVAPDNATAWKMVRSARSDPDKSRAGIYKAWLGALTKGQIGTPDPDLQKKAQEATDKTLQYLDQEGSASGGAKSTQDGGGDQTVGQQITSTVNSALNSAVNRTVNGAIPKTQDTEDVVTPANVIPTDPAKRVLNKVYINKNGQMARWVGNGWQPINNTSPSQ